MTFKELQDIPDHTLLSVYQKMLTIRLYEEKIVELYGEQEMKTPVHLYLGEEAVAAAICESLCTEDLVFSNHRSHGHYLAKGGDMAQLTAELYGRQNGCSAGKGGSMHVVDPEAGVCGTSAIVGGGIPLAVGAALAFSIKKQNNVSVVFFGDGAVDEGVFHESLNFAALKKLPVLFVCENNLYATCSHRNQRQSFTSIHSLAPSYGIPSCQVDGNEAMAVYAASKMAIEKARTGGGPSFMECLTYRWKGHVGPDCDARLGYRCQTELDQWRHACPVKRFKKHILQTNLANVEQLDAVHAAINKKIEASFHQAKESAFPSPEQLYENVTG